MAGTGAGAAAADATGLLEKKSLLSLPNPISEKGVKGVIGLREEDEELSAVKKPLSMLEKSLSLWIESDEELASEPVDTLRMSGALRAWTLVVERSSVGREILALLMVPGAYFTVQDRGSGFSSPRVCARARLVKLRTRDMVLVVSKRDGGTGGRWISFLRWSFCPWVSYFVASSVPVTCRTGLLFGDKACLFFSRSGREWKGRSLEGRYGSAGVRTQSEGADRAKSGRRRVLWSFKAEGKGMASVGNESIVGA